jgi:hypothetical protein
MDFRKMSEDIPPVLGPSVESDCKIGFHCAVCGVNRWTDVTSFIKKRKVKKQTKVTLLIPQS